MNKDSFIRGISVFLLLLGVLVLIPWAFYRFPPKTYMEISFEEMGYALGRFVPGLLSNCVGFLLWVRFSEGAESPQWLQKIPPFINITLAFIWLLLLGIGLFSFLALITVLVLAAAALHNMIKHRIFLPSILVLSLLKLYKD